MRKHLRLISTIIVVFMILSVVLGMLIPFTYANTQSQLDEAKKQLEAIEQEKKSIQSQISSLANQQKTVEQEIVLLNKQIENTQAEITAISNVITGLDEQIAIEEDNLEKATIKMEEQYESFKTRTRVMYEGGETTYLDILLASENFFDMLSRMEISKQIIEYDKNLFTEYTNNAKLVEQTKINLETNRAEQATMKSNLDSQKATLQANTEASEKKMRELVASENSAKVAYTDIEKAEQEASALVAQYAKELSTGDYVGGTYTWPLPGYTRISSPFGPRTHPVTGVVNSNHKGIDLPAPSGTPVVAANAGTIIVSKYSSSYGNYVMVDHGGGNVTLYAHLSKRSVEVGDVVGKGSTVGLVGTTGMSTGNHLHFEIIENGTHKNPMNYYS